MLNKILPPNSPVGRKLAFLARHLTVAVPPKIRKNFSRPTPEGITQLRELLAKTYLPSWYSGMNLDGYLDSEEGRMELENHLSRRLELDRYQFVPWVDRLIPLDGASVLEIGCGSGSATLAMAEQGARVTAIDVHREALEVSKLRAHVHGVGNVSFIEGDAGNLKELVPGNHFDLVVFFAVLEHMTLKERKSALRAAWELLPTGKHICITNTPNRLWFYDRHTSFLPFYNWLPDELAFEYSRRSSRYPFNTRFRKLDSESMLSFIREGRGFSFHEVDLAVGDEYKYEIVSDMTSFLTLCNPAMVLKRLLARDAKRERLLNSFAPDRHRGFFREYVDVLIKKLR